MLTDDEKEIIKEINVIEDRQRSAMKEINSILMSIPNVLESGEEQYPELKSANDNMKNLISRRIELMLSIGLEPKGPLPENIEKHYLQVLLDAE